MNSATWNNYLARTWDRYLPPIRPYPEELDVIKGYVSDFIHNNEREPRVLILGSTPEFRDILYEFTITPVVVDFSKENYDGMSLLLRNRGKDIFIQCDWLDMEKHIKQTDYDFILSEAAFNVLNPESSRKLYQICSKLINNNGKILVKEWIRFSDNKPDLQKVLEDYRKSNSSSGLYSYSCIPLILQFYDYQNEMIALRAFDRAMALLCRKKIITHSEWETIGIHEYQNVDLKLYIPKITEFLRDITNNAILYNMHIIDKPNAQYHPIFVFGRK